jgi:hypothetical protein
MNNEPTKTKAKKPTKPRGHRATTVQKGQVLTVLEFMDGNIKRTALLCNMTAREVTKLRDESMDGNSQPVMEEKRKANERIIEVVVRYLECLLALTLMRVGEAEFNDMYKLLGTMFDKLTNLQGKTISPYNAKLLPAQYKRLPLPAEPAPPAPVAAPIEATPTPAPVNDKTKWENIVARIMADAEENGRPLMRSEVIQSVVKERPEAAAFLCDEPVERLM